MNLAVGMVINNRYRIVVLLGEGGMGAVYRAWDTHLNMPVAIKENLDTTPEAQRQFTREAHILAKLTHPNLPRVIGHFFMPGLGQYLLMDFIEGEDLQTVLERRGAIQETQLLNWILQICDALIYLHNLPSPVIHRDIKPANIIIRPDGRAMLVDFGITKIYDPHMITTIGAKAVTPGYSPPEQYGGGITDTRSDIYSLGATMYALITGQIPPESVHRLARISTLIQPRQWNNQISPFLEQVIVRAMEIAIDQRFQTVREMDACLREPSFIPVTPPPAIQPTALVTYQPIAHSNSTTLSPKPAFQLTKPLLAIIITIVGCSVIIATLGVGLFSKILNKPVAGGVSPAIMTVSPTHRSSNSTLPATMSNTPTSKRNPIATLTPEPKTFSRTLEIRGDQDWQSTGITLQSRDLLTIRYVSGQWSPWGGGSCDGYGMSDTDPLVNNIVTGVLHASLIGRIDSQNPFYIGNEFSQVINHSGEVHLRINDTVLDDNSGEITVSIEVARFSGSDSSAFEVFAEQGWQSTGISVEKGATVKIEVISGQWTNAKGDAPYNSGEGGEYICGNFIDSCVEPLPSFPTDGLIGRIGEYIFGIGKGATITAPQTGVLDLRMNDGDNGLLDNDGSLIIKITILS